MKRKMHAKDKTEAPAGRLVGYARVSTTEQTLDLQIDALLKAGVHPDNIHTDKLSGASKRRPGLENALRDCVDGDTLVVWKLDRFGRSTLDVLTRIEALRERGVQFRSIMEGFDLTTPMGVAFASFLAAFAQLERDFGRQRTRAGMEAARARGKKFGAPVKLDLGGARELFRRGKTVMEVARHYKCSKSAVYNQFRFAEIEKLRAEGEKARRR